MPLVKLWLCVALLCVGFCGWDIAVGIGRCNAEEAGRPALVSATIKLSGWYAKRNGDLAPQCTISKPATLEKVQSYFPLGAKNKSAVNRKWEPIGTIDFSFADKSIIQVSFSEEYWNEVSNRGDQPLDPKCFELLKAQLKK